MFKVAVILSALLVAAAAGPTLDDLVAEYMKERQLSQAATNVCAGRDDYTFVDNERGCAWYHLCVNEVATEGRCPQGFWFDAPNQWCDYVANVDCVLDDRWQNLICPNQGLHVIPHPYTCQKYTSKCHQLSYHELPHRFGESSRLVNHKSLPNLLEHRTLPSLLLINLQKNVILSVASYLAAYSLL